MRKFRYAFFVLTTLLLASCAQKKCDIIDWSTSGVTGVRMPIEVTFTEDVIFPERIPQDAITFSPSADFEVTALGAHLLRIKPKAPLKYDTEYKVTVDASRLTGGKIQGVDDFIFYTPKLFFTYDDGWLQESEDASTYTLIGNVASSDYVDSTYIAKNFRVIGTTDIAVQWSNSDDGMTHQYTISNIKPKMDEEYTLSLIFDYNGKKVNEFTIPIANKYSIISNSISADPLAIIVTFSKPLKPNQDFKNLVRTDLSFRTAIEKNRLYIYPESKLVGDVTITISSELLSNKGQTLPESQTFTINLPSRDPKVRFVSNGSVLPSSNNMTVLFESINFQSARVRVRQIYANNLLQFFQQNNLSGRDYHQEYDEEDDYYYDYSNFDMNLVSRVVRDSTIDLGNGQPVTQDKAATYSLNLSELITDSQKSMYMLEIRGVNPLVKQDGYTYDYDYYFGDYRTYKQRMRIIVESNIGVVCMNNGDNEYIVYTTDLVTARPKSGCKVKIFNFQNQQIAESSSDSEGRALLKPNGEPYIVMAEADGEATFVKIKPALAISMSNFDVDGASYSKGIKGYIFGERGVWRPGDKIYLTFMVTSDTPLPKDHPATLTFYNPSGQTVTSQTKYESADGIYTFELETEPGAPTGLWKAEVGYGGSYFQKTVRVDAIKPNRIKIGLELGNGEVVDAKDFTGTLTAKWLHGTPASNCNVTISAQLSQMVTKFKGYNNYSFDDATKYFRTEERDIVHGKTNSQGTLELSTNELASLNGETPGMIYGKYQVKVFEPSGDFSVDQTSTLISPYKAYFGISVPMQTNQWGETFLDRDQEHTINLVLLDPYGAPIPGTEDVTVTVYRSDAWWWWDSAASSSQSNYARQALNSTYKTLTTELVNGKGTVTMRWNPNDYGSYMIRVASSNQLHTATKLVNISSSYWMDGGVTSDPNAATRLTIRTDKKSYFVGDKAKITIPSAAGARALVSLEKGDNVRENFWIDCTEKETSFEVPLKVGMSPNIYVAITLIQPHNTTLNDAPMRLFGVLRLPVEDPAKKLVPIVSVPESVRPESEMTIKVSEKSGQKMSYVVAVVDEGLLGLTRFKTPDPYSYFNATEALGVRTWDMFDNVIGAYGAKIEKMFAIGGDEEAAKNIGAPKAQRFKPVVAFIDAQKLEAGKTNTHKITLPPYFGEVRVMVIGSDGARFGSAEKDVAVKKPLLIQATMPRVLSSDEEVVVPVTVFALEDGVGKINLKITTNEYFTAVGPASKSITLAKSGEEVVSFRLKVGEITGIGKVKVTATSSNDSSISEIELDVREPNPFVTVTKDYVLDAGKSVTVGKVADKGVAQLELSSIPAISMTKHMEYLVRYPHGCIEQITSGAFPQLYLPAIVQCSPDMLQDIDRNIKSVLSRLPSYQITSGGFSYWPGNKSANQWGSIYATHFLIEAAKHGYGVDRSMLNAAIGYLRRLPTTAARTDAYRQYVLALNGTADRSAMNKLREKTTSLTSDAICLLASAYALDGNKKVASDLYALQSRNDLKVDRYSDTFDSNERRRAITLMTLTLLDENSEAFRVALQVADILKSSRWLSTQSTAWLLNTFSAYAVSQTNGIKATVGKQVISTDKSLTTVPLTGDVQVKNNGTSPIFLVVSQTYAPAKGDEIASADNLRLDVRYTDVNGAAISPVSLKMGTDFYATVTVYSPNKYETYTNMALTHIVPAGWEITSERDLVSVDYQDIRDDRVLSYFDLPSSSSKSVRIKLTATYQGHYYLPSIYCEAMYDDSVHALEKGYWIDVVE